MTLMVTMDEARKLLGYTPRPPEIGLACEQIDAFDDAAADALGCPWVILTDVGSDGGKIAEGRNISRMRGTD